MRLLKLLTTLMVAATLAACAAVPGKYSEPVAKKSHAVVKVQNKIANDASQAQGGWQMPGMESGGNYKTMLFQVDGKKITEVGGVQEVRVKPGNHEIQVMVDDGLIPLKGDLKGNFVEAHTYDINIVREEHDEHRYRADLVDEADSSNVIDQARF